MPMPRKPYRDWTPGDLAELLEEPKATETARVDFKVDCKLLSDVHAEKERARESLLKDVAAMANGVGGALLIGVDELRGPDTPPVAASIPGLDTNTLERLKDSIKSLVDTHLDVRPAMLTLTAVPTPDDPERQVLIVEVPQNTYSLSMVTYGQPPMNQFWVRRGTDNRLMRTDEIQYELERMVHVRDTAEVELDKIRDDLWRNGDGKFAWFAAVPVGRHEDHVPVVPSTMVEVLSGSSYFRRTYGLSGRIPQEDTCATPFRFAQRLRPSLHGLSYGERGGEDVLEIHRDGTVVWGTQPSCSQVDGLLSLHIFRAWTTGLCLVQDLQENFGVSSCVIAQAGLMRCEGSALQGWNRNVTVIDLRLDKVLFDESSNVNSIAEKWQLQFANAVGEHALPLWMTT